jgi:hypothetical protein
MVRMRLLALVALALGAAAVVSGTAAAGLTLGQTSATADYICPGEYDVQTSVASGPGFVVPAGTWRITSWSTFAGATGGTMQMLFFHPDATPNSFTVVAASGPQVLTPGALNTFPVGGNMLVHGGDVLGFWSLDAACSTGTANPGDASPFNDTMTPLNVGESVGTVFLTGYLSNISATLTPLLPTSKDDCKSGGWASFGVFKNQGDCVSFVASGGKNPPARG